MRLGVRCISPRAILVVRPRPQCQPGRKRDHLLLISVVSRSPEVLWSSTNDRSHLIHVCLLTRVPCVTYQYTSPDELFSVSLQFHIVHASNTLHLTPPPSDCVTQHPIVSSYQRIVLALVAHTTRGHLAAMINFHERFKAVLFVQFYYPSNDWLIASNTNVSRV